MQLFNAYSKDNGAPVILMRLTKPISKKVDTFLDNIDKLLRNLEGISELNRTARFRTVITFVDGRKELHSEGIVEGLITTDPRGNDGFCYDPIFLPRDSQFTFSEMTQVDKNKISHRGKALIKMKKLLEPYFKREKL